MYVMYVKSILSVLLFISLQKVSTQDDEDYDDYYDYNEDLPRTCPTAETIKGGRVTYSQEGLEGSVLTYHCDPGRYPFPVSSRICGADGEWTPMRLDTGRRVSRATCKDILCPAQLQLDNGDFWPSDQWFPVGTTQSFSCQEGYTLYGSAQRNCTISGEWTGTTPICDDHAGDCDNPGIPPGAQRSPGRFETGQKVVYWCQTGLDLLGSAERVCLEDSREWSGSEPRCQGLNTFDSPSSVAEAMGASLAGVMDVFTPDAKKKAPVQTFARTFRVAEGSRMHVYILLDTSGSIKKEEFENSRNATIALINKLDSYEIQMNFHVLSFASEVKVIVDIMETDISGDPESVIASLMEFDYHSHENKTGTNLYKALHEISEPISSFRQNSKMNFFNETQNIIIIQTDGYSNTGKAPQKALAQIRHLLNLSYTALDHTDETMLDVYVFGIGEQVNKPELNSLASKKRGEKHFFVLKTYTELGEMFNKIISDESVTMCGVAQEEVKGRKRFHTKPWHVMVRAAQSECSGSIVSQNFVLTAAHCFLREYRENVLQEVDVLYGDNQKIRGNVFIHPNYNINRLKDRNVSEFYDYDVALVQLAKPISLSWTARPICLPCTVPASRALKKTNSTCQQHRKELLPHTETPAFFINKASQRKATHIHTESQRPSCVEKARQTLKKPTNVTLDEYITRRFLCTGGTSGHQDSVSCKGDSGGSLFLEKRKRYFQVGVVAWGTKDVCKWDNSDKPPADARDFHINVFEILPWLKKYLGKDIRFLPEIN